MNNMKNKPLVIIIAAIVALVLIGGGIAVYFVMNANKSANDKSALTAEPESKSEGTETVTPPGETGSTTASTSEATGTPVQTKEQDNNFGRLVTKDNFSLRVPDAWVETQAPTGVSLMLKNNSEQITNQAAKQIGFKSYLAVIRDNLGSNTIENYLSLSKDALKQAIPGITFAKEDSTSIGGRQAKVLEADISQQGINFKVLMFIISGENKEVWVISFNALSENWNANKSLFYQIAWSFKLK